MNNKLTIKEIITAETYMIRLMMKTNVKQGVFFLLLYTVYNTIPLVSTYLWKLIIDQFTIAFQQKAASSTLWTVLGIYLAMQVLASLLREIQSVVGEDLNTKAGYLLDIQIMQKVSSLGAAFYDDPKNKDLISAAQQHKTYVSGSINHVATTLVLICTFIAGLVMFLSINPFYGILFILTYIPGAITSYKDQKRMDQFSINSIPENRKKDYFRFILTDAYYAKDLRLYNLAKYIKDKFNVSWKIIRQERTALFTKGTASIFLSSLISLVGLIAIIIFSVYSVILGTMAIGTFAMYVGLASTLGDKFQLVVISSVTNYQFTIPRTNKFIQFLDYENDINDNGTEDVAPLPEIEFRNVYFKYPNNIHYTLNDLSFKIISGKKIALIGVNGAGKSTIIKLLLRFYEPESGQILVGGNDIKSYPVNELRKLFGVCFQDINKYSLTFKENIAISDIERLNDADAIKAAAAASGADKIYLDMENGLNSNMTRKFNDEGYELSGGQWQKVAIARAFFRDADIVILDEPSSALDPEAEDFIFSSFKRLCRDKGGILISHRLSSVMMVDEIVLIDHGAVVETGTHTELIKQNGKYAEMYRMQAEKYVTPKSGGGANG